VGGRVVHYFDAYHHHFNRFRHQPRSDKLVVVEVSDSVFSWLMIYLSIVS
jgi:hypothetical protein